LGDLALALGYVCQKENEYEWCYQYTLQVLNNKMSLVFYDVTTLYFEIEQEDDLRKTGFSLT
jgi:hypothetical protein